MRRRAKIFALVFALLASPLLTGCDQQTSDIAAQTSPATDDGWARPEGPLLDRADVIPSQKEAELDAALRRSFEETGHPIVVVTTPSLEGRSVEDFTLSLFNDWGVGTLHRPGVMLLVAPNERKVRITVGTGLEAVLTNDVCAQIISADILPRFRAGDFHQGIDAGFRALNERLRDSDEASTPLDTPARPR